MTRPMILIVEDDASIREVMAELLRAEGMTVICARDGNEAWSVLSRGTRPHLVLLDLTMPNVSGGELRARIADEGLDDIPVIVVTASPVSHPESATARCKVILKPFDFEELLREIRIVLAGSAVAQVAAG